MVRRDRVRSQRRWQTLVDGRDGNAEEESRCMEASGTGEAERDSDPVFPKEPGQVPPRPVPCHAVTAEPSQPCSGRATERPGLGRALARMPRSWMVPMRKLRPRSVEPVARPGHTSSEAVQGLRCGPGSSQLRAPGP